MGLSNPAKRSPRELIVILKPEIGVVDHMATIASVTPHGTNLATFLAERAAKIRPIFRQSPIETYSPTVAAHLSTASESSLYHEVIAPDDQLDTLHAAIADHSR
jgi:hypothetical protein